MTRKSGRILIRTLISICVLLMTLNKGNLFVLLLYELASLIFLCIYLLLRFYVKNGRQEEGGIGNMWVYNTVSKYSVRTVLLTSVIKS
jgi:hypothetical protein